MANLLATLKINLGFQGPGGGTTSIPQQTAEVAYGASGQGQVDVPAGTVANDPFDVPFGSIAAATLLLVINNTSQDLKLKVNGDSEFILVGPGKPAVVMGPLTAATMTATEAGPSTDAERFSYFVFGDAV